MDARIHSSNEHGGPPLGDREEDAMDGLGGAAMEGTLTSLFSLFIWRVGGAPPALNGGMLL